MKVVKNKYFIEFEGFECLMSNRIRISKNEFDDNLSNLIAQTVNNGEREYPIENNVKKYSHEHCDEIVYIFTCGTSTTYLTKLSCHDGYKFTEV